jgi:hypothetical protein
MTLPGTLEMWLIFHGVVSMISRMERGGEIPHVNLHSTSDHLKLRILSLPPGQNTSSSGVHMALLWNVHQFLSFHLWLAHARNLGQAVDHGTIRRHSTTTSKGVANAISLSAGTRIGQQSLRSPSKRSKSS